MKILGIGDLIVTGNPEEVIKTFSLGSCVALILYSPEKRVLGMSHIALPNSLINPYQGRETPGFFADTAIRLLLGKMQEQYRCNIPRVQATLVGGAAVRWEQRDYFNIGSKNIAAIHDYLQRNRISMINSDQTGGYYSRTVKVAVSDGNVDVTLFSLMSSETINGD